MAELTVVVMAQLSVAVEDEARLAVVFDVAIVPVMVEDVAKLAVVEVVEYMSKLAMSVEKWLN